MLIVDFSAVDIANWSRLEPVDQIGRMELAEPYKRSGVVSISIILIIEIEEIFD